MSKSDGMAPGLSPEDQARARAAMENLRRRHEEGMYRGRPAIPEKTDSMVPGISVVRPAPGPPVPFGADGEEEEDDVND